MPATAPLPPGERAEDELSTDAALFAIEAQLRGAARGPDFRRYLVPTSCAVWKAPTGIAVRVEFARCDVQGSSIPERCDLFISQKRATELAAKLCSALGWRVLPDKSKAKRSRA